MTEAGAVVTDRDLETGSIGVVVNRLGDCTAEEWDVHHRDGTVADDNPDYPADSSVVLLVYSDDLSSEYPFYCGVRDIPVHELNERNIQHYAYPRPRLKEIQPRLGLPEVDVDRLQPMPYHSRNFQAAENRDYIAAIREQGGPASPPLVQAKPDGSLQLINGHKRTWACYVADVDQIQVLAVYADDYGATKGWINRHLDDYTPQEQAAAVQRLRRDWGDTFDLDRPVLADGGGGDR